MSGPALPLACLAPAKVNLGLLVGSLREDGRHEVLTVMQSISLADQLTLEWAPPEACGDEVSCPGVEGENLALAAIRAFREDVGFDAGPVRLAIVKRIPIAAGLGGGSADAAGALRLLALAAGLSGPGRLGAAVADRLRRLGETLGADVPAQVLPGRWLGTGSGASLRALPGPRSPFGMVVVPQPTGLSAAEVYRRADELEGLRSREQLEEARMRLERALGGGAALPPADLLANDLEGAAVSLCPAIEQALERARVLAADHVLVSGSGPTVVGLFGGTYGPLRARAAAAALAQSQPPVTWAVPVGARFASAVTLGAQQSRQIDR